MIEVKDLQFTYPGNREKTIKDLDFSISKGEIFGLLGPSGAGKSTTQKIIIGILRGYSGQVRAMGKELKKCRSDYYEKIGVAFEFPNHSLPWWASKKMEKEEFLSFPKA